MMTLILFIVLSLLCFISPSYSQSSPYPTQLSLTIQTESAPFGARSQQGVEALPSGSLIVLGTGPLGEQTNDCWKSTDDGISWSKVGSAPWAPRRGHRSLLMENNSTTELWVLGGYNANTNTYFNDVWMTNDECVSWNKIGDSFPGIEGPCVANTFDVALSTTGKMAQNNNAPSSNVYLSDDGSSWTFIADERVNGIQYTQWRLPSKAQARYNAACTSLGSLIVIAGGTNSTGGALTDIWAFDTSYEKWYQIRNLPVSRAGGIIIGRLPKLFLIGGKDLTDNTYKDDVWEWTMSSIDNINNQLPWIKSFDSLSFGGLTSAATVYNSKTDKFIVVGGMNAGGSSSKILKIAMEDVPLCTGLTINNYE